MDAVGFQRIHLKPSRPERSQLVKHGADDASVLRTFAQDALGPHAQIERWRGENYPARSSDVPVHSGINSDRLVTIGGKRRAFG